MGEYCAVRKGKFYDVALIIDTPAGKEQYLFGKNVKTMREAREIAKLFNAEVGYISDAEGRVVEVNTGAAFRYEPEPYPLSNQKMFGYVMDTGGTFADCVVNPAAVVASLLQDGKYEVNILTNEMGRPESIGFLSQTVTNDTERVTWTICRAGPGGKKDTVRLIYHVENYEQSAIEMLVAVLSGFNWDRRPSTPFDFMRITHDEFGLSIVRMLKARKELQYSWDMWAQQYNRVMKSARAYSFSEISKQYEREI